MMNIITQSAIGLSVIFAKYVVFVLLSYLARRLDIIFRFKLKMRGQSVEIYICFGAHALFPSSSSAQEGQKQGCSGQVFNIKLGRFAAKQAVHLSHCLV
jgi:hypothetical protein